MAPSLRDFLNYWENIHNRTARLLPLVPEDKLEWRFAEDKFSFGDIFRHLAGIERYMFVELATGRENSYPGHARELADGAASLKRYYETLHEASVSRLEPLSDEDLLGKCRTPAGARISIWKWLRAMLEHECHHRGQLYLMLGMLGIDTPPLFGLTSEEVLRGAQSCGGRAGEGP